MIELTAGDWSALLRPEVGGAIASLTFAGIPILRTMPDTSIRPLEAACFPLVPYANRIPNGQFSWAGRQVSLRTNMGDHPHPLHGSGWLAPWREVRRDPSSALLEHAYDGLGDWPWAYVAHQHIALDAAGCTVRLMVQNSSVEAAPIGLGFHPYFRRSAETRVHFEAAEMLGIDADCLPTGERHAPDALAPWSEGAALPQGLVDNSFTGWGGTATITDDKGTITLRGFGTPICHVFAPANGGELCLEPVSHPPDAVNRSPQSIPVLPPGCVAGIAMRVETVVD